jgi:23S rRNA (cytosine1962-C5)-methyltransferase
LNPFDIQSDVHVSVRGAQRLRHGHLWVYAGDLTRESRDPAAPIVRVLDHGGNVIGYALYSAQSQIRLRLLVRGDDPPTPDLLRRRLESSIARRPPISPGTASRLVSGEADLLPSIVVDRYAECISLQTLSRGADALKPVLVEQLHQMLYPLLIVERNDVRARILEGLEEKRGILLGNIPRTVEIVENGVRFLVDPLAGQKTGFFLDQRDNRVAAAAYAHGRALDCFSNTGAFALHFARRCESVAAVDISRDSLEQARSNAELNAVSNLSLHEANVFDHLRELERRGDRFDTICLDPPAFAKNRGALSSARSGYKEINLRAMKLLNPEGILVTSSCSYHLSETDFAELIADAARDAHRYAQVLEKRGQAHDHPVLATMPETAYLKCFILRIL